MTRVVAVIPTIGLSPHLRGLLEVLQRDHVAVRLMVNSEEIPSAVRDAKDLAHWGSVDHRPGDTIYQEWNEAAEWACSIDAYLLVLNDDIAIASGFAHSLGSALDQHPDYGLISACPHLTSPVSAIDGAVHPAGFRAGDRRAFVNWAFAARPEAWQMIGDYEIWYGDDDLIAKVGNAGWGVGYLEGVGVSHDTSCTTRQMPWTNEAVARDHARWVASGQG
jgi:hypothetical protein